MARNRFDVGLSKADRIRQVLEQEIVTGQRSNGERLDSETQLMERFSVSRNTVRKGLDELARQGLITKRGGVGSFVTYEGQLREAAPGWSRMLASDEEQLDTHITSLGRGSCSRTRRFLEGFVQDIPAHDDDYLRIDRIRRDRVFGIGLSIERSRLPWRAEFHPILENGLVDNSIRTTLAALNIDIGSGKEWACVESTLSEQDAELMRRECEEPMLRLNRISFSPDGDMIEFLDSLLDPSRFTLHLDF